MYQLRCQKQGGFILFSLMVTLALLSVILATYYWRSAQERQVTEAKILGNQIAEYVSAVQDYMVNTDDKDDVGNHTTLGFLKNKNCPSGTNYADEDYLPCDFNFDRFHNSLMRKDPIVTINDDVGEKKETATITLDHITTRDGNKYINSPYLAAVVAQAAQAHYGNDQNAVYNGNAIYNVDKDSAVITIDVTVTGANSTWLRIDGNNAMQGSLKFDMQTVDGKVIPESDREIHNVSNIYMNANSAYITNDSGDLVLDAADNFQATADKQAYISGSDKSTITTGDQAMTIDPSKISFTGKSFNVDTDTTEISSNTTNINVDKGSVYLGNQSGEAGNSNVTVNDLTIHAPINGKSDQNITSLLNNNVNPIYKCYEDSDLDHTFDINTGPKGKILLSYNGWGSSGGDHEHFSISLKVNGNEVKYRNYDSPEDNNTMQYHEQYLYDGQPNEKVQFAAHTDSHKVSMRGFCYSAITF